MAAPTVTAVSPDTGNAPQISANLVVTVTGTGFYNGGSSGAVTAVDFGLTAATRITVASDTSLEVVVPANVAGTVDVTVTTPGGTSATSTADQFTYTPTIATQVPGPPGSVITFQAAGTGVVGDSFTNDGRTVLRVLNSSGGSVTVTVAGEVPCSQGHLHDEVITIASGTEETAGPFPTSQFNEAVSGNAVVTYSATASVTVAAVRGG